MSINHDADQILSNAHRPLDPELSAAARAHCTRFLDGDALAEVCLMLGLGGVE